MSARATFPEWAAHAWRSRHHPPMGNPGESADEHARRLIDEAGAWAAGAEGERRVAAALADLSDTWVVVHDRLLRPGRSEANLDHIAVGPTGVYLVDAKNRAGIVTEHDGGLYQHRTRNGVRESISLADELKKVHGMAAYMAAEADTAVVPVLCLAGSRSDEFGEPRLVRGVWVVPVAALAAWLRSRDVIIPPDRLAPLATRVITEFPSTTTDVGLLAAMGGAKAGRRVRTRSGTVRTRPARRGRPRPSRGARVVSLLGRLLLLAVAATLAWTVLPHLPAALGRLAPPQPGAASGGASPSAPGTPMGVSTSSAKPSAGQRAAVTKPGSTPRPASPPTVLGPPDCSDATAAEIASILHRAVKPIVTRHGCAWGTRLDDPTTQLVSILMTPDHAD